MLHPGLQSGGDRAVPLLSRIRLGALNKARLEVVVDDDRVKRALTFMQTMHAKHKTGESLCRQNIVRTGAFVREARLLNWKMTLWPPSFSSTLSRESSSRTRMWPYLCSWGPLCLTLMLGTLGTKATLASPKSYRLSVLQTRSQKKKNMFSKGPRSRQSEE